MFNYELELILEELLDLFLAAVCYYLPVGKNICELSAELWVVLFHSTHFIISFEVIA